MEEVIICLKCRFEFDLLYQDDEVVSESKCNCKSNTKFINGKKPLDYAVEVLNEKSISKNQRYSKTSKIRT